MNLTINDVPEDCKDEVLRLATVAVDRYFREQNEVVSGETLEASNKSKDDFRVANGLKKKYDSDIEPDPVLE